MKRSAWISAGVIALVAPAAVASDFRGMMSAVLGIPVMGIAVLVFGILALFPRLPKPVFVTASVLFAAVMIFGVALADDATFNLRRTAEITYLYFGLFALAIGAYLLVTWRYMSHRARSSAPPSQ